MDWSLDETQAAIRELAPKILATKDDPWAAIVNAGLLEVITMTQVCSLVVEVGRAGGTVPVLETLVLGGPLRVLSRIPRDAILTAGLLEPTSRNPRHATTEFRDGRLYGTKICVPVADRASHIVVPAKDGLYAASLADCAVELQAGTNDEVVATVVLDGAPALPLGTMRDLDRYLLRVDLGISALLLGLSHGALALTAKYVSDREQFSRKIGTFQAVSQRAADAWIDTQAMEVTLFQAAWRMDEEFGSHREVAIARYTAAEASHRVLASAQHLHGGIGFDRDYPLYRYFLTAKAWEFVLGGASAQLERLGEILAEG